MALCYINYSQRLEFTKNNNNNNNNLLPWDSFFPILTLSKGASLNSSFMQDCEDQIPKRVAVVACSWNPGRISKCSRPDSSTLCVLGQLGLDLTSSQNNQTKQATSVLAEISKNCLRTQRDQVPPGQNLGSTELS